MIPFIEITRARLLQVADKYGEQLYEYSVRTIPYNLLSSVCRLLALLLYFCYQRYPVFDRYTVSGYSSPVPPEYSPTVQLDKNLPLITGTFCHSSASSFLPSFPD